MSDLILQFAMDIQTEIANWKEYVEAVKNREEHRIEAEAHEKKRKAAWREYYKLDARIKELDVQLGIAEAANDETPPAPKKLKFNKK